MGAKEVAADGVFHRLKVIAVRRFGSKADKELGVFQNYTIFE